MFSFNRYAYANNNPFKYIDPNGMESEEEEETAKDRSFKEANNVVIVHEVPNMDGGKTESDFETNTVGGEFERQECKSDVCTLASVTFETVEQISEHQTMNNMMVTFDNVLMSAMSGFAGKTMASLMGTTMSGKSLFVDSNAGYAIQVGDTMYREVSASFVSSYNGGDSGLKNMNVIVTFVNKEGIVMDRVSGPPNF